MVSTATLTSLAMLKVKIDHGGDYLDYLQPFIMQVLADQRPEQVTDVIIRDYLRKQFGLEIPTRTIQIILKRIARRHPLKLELGIFRITGPIPNPGIEAEKSKAERHIQAVVSGLMEFSKSTGEKIATSEEAVKAICNYLSQFDIPCLRAYLNGTVLPAIEDKEQSHIILVSEYVLYLQRTNPERFDSFIIMVQGHMLANALLCPDLQQAPKSYKGVTFYLDTPLLVRWLELEGASKKSAVEELTRLLHHLGATVAIFSHSRDELEHVIKGAARHINAPDGRGAIVMESRRVGTTKSDLLLIAGQIDERLTEAGIEVKNTPRYDSNFQIDETAFEKVLEDEVSYYNPRAKEYDINSVRSIYALRGDTSPSIVERCGAVLVSSNDGFAQAAFEFGKQHAASREVSAVITDFSLANMAWLKAPMGAPALPTTEVLAFSYAALQPSKELLAKFLVEIDKLEKQGKISARDHQLLRSSTAAQRELMCLTLGDESAITEETIAETLRRVTSEIKREENKKLAEEQTAHSITQKDLASEQMKRKQIQGQLYWRCYRKARWCARSTFVAVFLNLVLGSITGFVLAGKNPLVGWGLRLGSLFFVLFTVANMMYGVTAKNIYNATHAKCLAYLLRHESRSMGINLEAS
jgi:hypothetical protein